MVILDTCAIIEACKPYPDFSSATSDQMELGTYILSISFAEIAGKIKLGKLLMNISVSDLFNEYKQTAGVQIVDIGINEWLDSIELQWHDNKDPADRIITAFATKKNLPIVTCDQKIKSFYTNVIW